MLYMLGRSIKPRPHQTIGRKDQAIRKSASHMDKVNTAYKNAVEAVSKPIAVNVQP